ncbi:period circadian protein homolog 1 [Rhinatrema bivittatum]|uniref:period circadian protein homolog 1 n=1 Tax=Rhinatrema bivittatum TaxID=194408 RepID=UPI001126D3A5|nr:period circadian protein homolog 1 [Rhinatrema bivittatum]
MSNGNSNSGPSHSEGEASSESSGAGRRGRASRGGEEAEAERRNRSNDDMDTTGSGNESRGRDSRSSHSSTNGKDSALLETTESNKSTNSQSPSPPSSSIAYSLLSASSEHNPSTSGCSSEQSAREKTQKELMKALKELKIRLPSEKRSKGKSGTLATLQYALSCVKQVRANQDYYQQWTIDDTQPCSLDMSSYTLEELENITSEYNLKNPDTFSLAVSFITGKIVYISDQAAFILRCKRDVFKGASFAEFLAPQDVSVFYGSTAPYHLPSWSACTSADAALMDYTQEKSVFCRISGARDLHYYPFRLTPYLMKVRDSDSAEGQPCCLLIAERVHSGYEAPRIPPDKRIFTTRHTPGCVFQEVDERAVPLLGYLPQDLIGTPVLLFVHPEDRQLMLAIHKKILQCAGQPFDHSPIRFCARNGEYVTIDTSWSSFVNPWSRKVSFILGRHKVRTGPLNEDIFTAPKGVELKAVEPDVQELSEQIHKILLQPVHTSTSAGNGSGGSNASHEQFLSVASSSDGHGMAVEEVQALRPMTFQQICKNIHMVKNQGQQMFIGSRAKPQKHHLAGKRVAVSALRRRKARRDSSASVGKAAAPEESPRKDLANVSYQQINCLDSIIRYLESCNIPNTVKRKCGSSSYTTSSTSDDDRQKAGEDTAAAKKDVMEEALDGPRKRKEPPAAVVGAPLTPLALPSKAESVVSITSQCSFSSTIVHVGDKKPPESDIVMMEEAPSTPAPVSMPAPSMAQDKDQYRKVGLTKEVLSIHTQKEEQAFLVRFRDLSRVQIFNPPQGLCRQDSRYPGQHPDRGQRGSQSGTARGGPGSGRRGRSGKSKAKRLKQQKSAEGPEPALNHGSRPHPQGLPGSSPCSLPSMPFPTIMPAYPLPVFHPRASMPPAPEPMPQDARYPMQPPQFPAPLVTPMVALVLPNFMFPQMGGPLPPFYPSQGSFGGTPMYPFPPPPATQAPSTTAPATPGPETTHPASRSTTPHSLSQRDGAGSPLFESRCSSPLQLNLLQMEEAPKSAERQEGGGASNQGGGAASNADWNASGAGSETAQKEACLGEANELSNNDALSSSSDLLDLLLQEDSQSGTGSAVSGSMASGGDSSNGGGSTSASGTRSSQSSNTSKYFGSVDSSENDRGSKKRAEQKDNEHFIKYVMQDPIWLLMANTDHKVMMTYQLPGRDVEAVLRQDREKLKQMQKQQPRFTEEQKKELAEVHPWMRKGLLPKAIDVTACEGCGSGRVSSCTALPYDVGIHEMELSVALEPIEEGAEGCRPGAALGAGDGSGAPPPPPEIRMEEEEESGGETSRVHAR